MPDNMTLSMKKPSLSKPSIIQKKTLKSKVSKPQRARTTSCPIIERIDPLPLHGWLEKQTRNLVFKNSWRVTYVVIFQNQIWYHHHLDKRRYGRETELSLMEVEDLVHPKTGMSRIPLSSESSIIAISNMEFCISVKSQSRKKKMQKWNFRTTSKAQRETWMAEISKIIHHQEWLCHTAIGHVIGEGASGTVRLLHDRRTGIKYATKIIDLDPKSEHRDIAENEIQVFQQIMRLRPHSPTLMKLHRVYEHHQTQKHQLYMVMPFCSGGELYDHILQEEGRYTEQDAARLMLSVMHGIEALHGINVLHLDLKPENILFHSRARTSDICLADFGLAHIMPTPDSNHATLPQLNMEHLSGGMPRGTPGFMAPEIITEGEYSVKADVFSAGVVLYILLVGRPPFYQPGNDTLEVIRKTVSGELGLVGPDWALVSSEAKDLVERMLCVVPRERLTVRDVLDHAWFRTMKENPPSESLVLTRAAQRIQASVRRTFD